MGRKAKRREVKTPAPRWKAQRNRFGMWVVVDAHGNEPLRDPDPLARMRHVHLAAAAPGLHEALAELVRRLTYLEPPYTADRRRVEMANGELQAARPSLQLLAEQGTLGRRLELALDGDEAA